MKATAIISFLFVLVSCTSNKDGRTDNFKTDVSRKSSKDDITIITDDSKTLSAYYFYNADQKEKAQPLVVLIHQFMLNKDQWSTSFIDSLLRNNYKVLAYDMRGHGKSSKVEYELTKLLSDPNEAPTDVKAVFKWAKNQKGIDSTRIAVIGTSIGGNLACYAKYSQGAKVVVAISNSKDGFYAMNGIDERMMTMGRPMQRISNVLLICGSKDGKHEQDQKDIYDNWLMDPKDMKVYDSDKHGKYLLVEHPEIYGVIGSWLQKYL